MLGPEGCGVVGEYVVVLCESVVFPVVEDESESGFVPDEGGTEEAERVRELGGCVLPVGRECSLSACGEFPSDVVIAQDDVDDSFVALEGVSSCGVSVDFNAQDSLWRDVFDVFGWFFHAVDEEEDFGFAADEDLVLEGVVLDVGEFFEDVGGGGCTSSHSFCDDVFFFVKVDLCSLCFDGDGLELLGGGYEEEDAPKSVVVEGFNGYLSIAIGGMGDVEGQGCAGWYGEFCGAVVVGECSSAEG